MFFMRVNNLYSKLFGDKSCSHLSNNVKSAFSTSLQGSWTLLNGCGTKRCPVKLFLIVIFINYIIQANLSIIYNSF
jgi:hypothetical protein